MSELESRLLEAGFQPVSGKKNCGQGEINICCLFCDTPDPSAHCGIDPDDGKFHCLRCGSGGGWKTLQWKLGIPLADIFGKVDDYDFGAPFGKKFDKTDDDREKDFYIDPALEHMKMWRFLLEERQLDEERCIAAGLGKGVNGFKGYAVFCDGNAAVGRNYLGGDRIKWKKPKGWRQRLFGAAWVKERAPEVGVIVEGVFDLLRFPRGVAAALLSKRISDDIANEIAESFLPSTQKLVLATDRDLTHREQSDLVRKLRGLLFEVTVPDWSQVDPDIKDVDEFFIQYGEEAMYEFLGIPQQFDKLSFIQ